jgi:hypothetical protein
LDIVSAITAFENAMERIIGAEKGTLILSIETF